MGQLQIDPPVPPVTGVNPASIQIEIPPYVSPILRQSEFIGQYGADASKPDTAKQPESIKESKSLHFVLIAALCVIGAYLLIKH